MFEKIFWNAVAVVVIAGVSLYFVYAMQYSYPTTKKLLDFRGTFEYNVCTVVDRTCDQGFTI